MSLTREEIERLDEDVIGGGSPLAAKVILELKRMALASLTPSLKETQGRPKRLTMKFIAQSDVGWVAYEDDNGEFIRYTDYAALETSNASKQKDICTLNEECQLKTDLLIKNGNLLVELETHNATPEAERRMPDVICPDCGYHESGNNHLQFCQFPKKQPPEAKATVQEDNVCPACHWHYSGAHVCIQNDFTKAPAQRPDAITCYSENSDGQLSPHLLGRWVALSDYKKMEAYATALETHNATLTEAAEGLQKRIVHEQDIANIAEYLCGNLENNLKFWVSEGDLECSGDADCDHCGLLSDIYELRGALKPPAPKTGDKL